MLFAHGGAQIAEHLPYGYGLTLFSPYLSLLFGVVWIVTGWNLLRLRNWARWIIMLLLAIGSAFAAVTMLTANVPFSWRIVFNWCEITIRAAAAFYLASSSTVVEAFTRREQK